MPDRELITIILMTTTGTDEWKMEVPHDVPARALINKLIRSNLGFRARDEAGNQIPYRLLWKEGERYLSEDEFLGAARVESGHTLVMVESRNRQSGHAELWKSAHWPDITARARDIEPAPSATDTSVAAGRSLIAVIGIDHYPHRRQLDNAVSDATAAAAEFGRLGFELFAEPLIDGAATGRAIQELVTDQLRGVGEDDRLVLFYAGHGTNRENRLGDKVVHTGYLVPFDATDKAASWIELDGWLRAVALLPARHVLVILDACHSGIALDAVLKWRDDGTWRDTPPETLNALRSRRIITSALAKQVAGDGGPVPGHSLFASCLLDGLRHGLGPSSGRVITGTELGLYLRRRVQSYPRSQQTPDFGTFDFDERGELLLRLAPEPGTHAGSAVSPATSTTAAAPVVATDSTPSASARTAEVIDALQLQVAHAGALIAEMSTHSQGVERHEVDISWGEERLSRWKARVIKYLDANLSHAEARRFSVLSSTKGGGCDIEHFESSARAHLSYLDALIHELRGKTIDVNPQERPSGKDLPVHPTFTYRKSR